MLVYVLLMSVLSLCLNWEVISVTRDFAIQLGPVAFQKNTYVACSTSSEIRHLTS